MLRRLATVQASQLLLRMRRDRPLRAITSVTRAFHSTTIQRFTNGFKHRNSLASAAELRSMPQDLTSSGPIPIPFRVDEELLTGLYRNKSLLVWDNPLPQPTGSAAAAAAVAASAASARAADDLNLNPIGSTTFNPDSNADAVGPRVYVVGTHHALMDSALHVRDVIRTVRPDVVIIESCRERVQPTDAAPTASAEELGWKSDPTTGVDVLTRPITFDTDAYLARPHNMTYCTDPTHTACQQQKALSPEASMGTADWRTTRGLNGSDILSALRKWRFFGDPVIALAPAVRYYYQYLDDLLDVHTGIEQTIAAREAQKLGVPVVLGDRLASDTLRDLYRALWTDFRLFFSGTTRGAMLEHATHRVQAEEAQRLTDQFGSTATVEAKRTANITTADGGMTGVWAPNPFAEIKAQSDFKNVLDTVYYKGEAPPPSVKQWAIDHWITGQRRSFWRHKQRADALGFGTVQHWSELLDEQLDPLKPAMHRALVEKRDRHITDIIRKFPGKTVVAVVGQSHIFGMQRDWADPNSFEGGTYSARVLNLMRGRVSDEERAKIPAAPVWQYLIPPKMLSPAWWGARKFTAIVVVLGVLFLTTQTYQLRVYGEEISQRHDRVQAPFYVQGSAIFLAGFGAIALGVAITSPVAIRTALTRLDAARAVWRSVKRP